jgi:hypothetical protein
MRPPAFDSHAPFHSVPWRFYGSLPNHNPVASSFPLFQNINALKYIKQKKEPAKLCGSTHPNTPFKKQGQHNPPTTKALLFTHAT